MKTLVGIGCSHTAGTAFLDGLTKSRDGSWLELTGGWASIPLAEKYKDGEPTMEWITNNLTWMAKLNNKLGIKPKYSIEFGINEIIKCIQLNWKYVDNRM